jgi:hypothetical protein
MTVKTSGVALATGFLTAALCTTALAAPATLPNTQKTGAQMVNRFMSHLATGNTAKLNALLAPSFLVQRANGTWAAKPAYMAQPPRVASYAISSSFSAYSRGALTVRWEVSTVEAVPGAAVGSAPAPRLSTFAWTPSGFVMTSHGNFNPPLP